MQFGENEGKEERKMKAKAKAQARICSWKKHLQETQFQFDVFFGYSSLFGLLAKLQIKKLSIKFYFVALIYYK